MPLFNKLNDSQDSNGIVSLSKFQLTEPQKFILYKGLVFCQIPGAPNIGKVPRKKNFSKQKYQAIKALRHNTDIIIEPADKGNAIVTVDKVDYIKEDHRQSSDTHFCESTDKDFTGEVL